jgi:hypothetical protein
MLLGERLRLLLVESTVMASSCNLWVLLSTFVHSDLTSGFNSQLGFKRSHKHNIYHDHLHIQHCKLQSEMVPAKAPYRHTQGQPHQSRQQLATDQHRVAGLCTPMALLPRVTAIT